MKRKVDKRGGNGDIVFDNENGTAKKYLRNTSSEERVLRFRRELSVLQTLQKNPIHNIVEIKEVHIDKSIPQSYIEMKKYDGSLGAILNVTKGNVRLSLQLILPIIKALYKLSFNDPQIFHRDIKPDNILYLKENGKYSLHITDFGTCFLNDGNERLTPDRVAVGPRMYMAPEYEIGKVDKVTEKGDIFSIGKVIWTMINGEEDAFLPLNLWFMEEYNLTCTFPNDSSMIVANLIIASCLAIDPEERCTYPELIAQIENFLKKDVISTEEENKYEILQYVEKREIELKEIKEKNRMLVNIFSRYYIEVLEKLKETYLDFILIQILYKEYKNKSKDGIDYITPNIEKNSAHYLYSQHYDRIYLHINYNPASKNEKYCNITIGYTIDNQYNKYKDIKIYYSKHGEIMCEFNDEISSLNVNYLYKVIEFIIMEYIKP